MLSKNKLCICLHYKNVKIKSLQDHIAELEKGFEELIIAALNAVQLIESGKAKADLRDAYDKATDQLETLKEQDK